MRLIDADALFDNVLEAYGIIIDESEANLFMKMITRAPTVNPESLQPQWIPVAERLPEDCDERFYMCVVENHESDPPMYLQYLENTGFGLWSNVFDEHTLGFIGSEFSTNEELGYEKVLAWMPTPEPYTPEGKDGNG